MQDFYRQVLWLCKPDKPQPAYFSTLKVYNKKPPYDWQYSDPIPATPEVKRWRQHDLIAWKKSQPTRAGRSWK